MVTVWYGEDDTSTSPEMSRALAAGIPGAWHRLLPGEGHLFFLARWREILDDLLVV